MKQISFIRFFIVAVVILPALSFSQSFTTITQISPALCFGDKECVDIEFSGLDNSLSYDLVIKRDVGGIFIEEDQVLDIFNDANFNVGNSLLNYCFSVEGDFILCLVLDGDEINNIAYETDEYPTDLNINILTANPSVICTGDEN
ncbi:MAG: hypothetical protein VXY06_03915, partial [Bacteroidota bacterium]|nr:hypothetical protein [Bacteroidota bacterium]